MELIKKSLKYAPRRYVASSATGSGRLKGPELFGWTSYGKQRALSLGQQQAAQAYRFAFTHPMLPHRPDKKGQSWQEAISPGQKLMLEIVSQPGNEKIPPTIMGTLGIWLLLGGIGKRSRRMFGALKVRLPGKQEEPEGLANYIGKLLRTAIGEPLDLPHPPEFLANYIGKLLRTAIGEPLDLPHPPEFRWWSARKGSSIGKRL